MQTVRVSSGDAIADRRFAYAQMLAETGDLPAAAELIRETLALVPQWIPGWYMLGEVLSGAGLAAEAVDAWREVLRLDPHDRFGASLRLELASAISGMDAPPAAYVETLFDQYADSFDAALVERLDYRVPELLEAAILSGPARRFAHAVDLGCGTGLLGERLRRHSSFMEGVDLSAGMLKQARAKQVYDRLSQADLAEAEFPAGVDLVTAADVFMYVGALDGVFARIAAALGPGGVFAFSVEVHDGPEAILLRPSRRYAHSQGALLALLSRSGFALASKKRATIRTDGGAPVEGLIVVAVRERPGIAAATHAEDGAGPGETRHLIH